jgi:hypothetical protein
VKLHGLIADFTLIGAGAADGILCFSVLCSYDLLIFCEQKIDKAIHLLCKRRALLMPSAVIEQ